MTRRGAWLTATVLGVGRTPVAPGTAGSLAGALLLAPLREAPPFDLFAVAAITGLAVWSAGTTAQTLRRRDPGEIVIDEVAGMGLALAAAPAGGGWRAIAAAFVLFRLFDILKPPPLRSLERLPGGWGIVADDLGAGLYAALALWGVKLLSGP